MSVYTLIASLSLSLNSLYILYLSDSVPIQCELDARSETSREPTVRSNLVGNAGSRPISEAKQPWACPVLGWGTTGEAHVLYSFSHHISVLPTSEVRTSESPMGGAEDLAKFLQVLPCYTRGVLWSWCSAFGTWRGLSQIPEYCGVGLLPWGLGGSKAK